MRPSEHVRRYFVEIVRHASDQWIELYQERKAGETHLFVRILPRGFRTQWTLHIGWNVEIPFPPLRHGA